MQLASKARILLGGSLLIGASLAWAGPKEDIMAAMKAGTPDKLAQANLMLSHVLAEHPHNALAHYWRAQVLRQQGNIVDAHLELVTALKEDPKKKFSGDSERLAHLERQLGVDEANLDAPTADAHAADSTVPARTGLSENAQAMDAASNAETSAIQQVGAGGPVALKDEHESSARGWVVSLIGVLICVAIFFGLHKWSTQRTRMAAIGDQRAKARQALEDGLQDLDDALKASDANGHLADEVKLGNYDRVRSAKSPLTARLATLASTEDFGDVRSLALRAHDIAADVRQEARPSVRQAEEAREERRAVREHDVAMAEVASRAPAPVYVQGGRTYGGGFVDDGFMASSLRSQANYDNAEAARERREAAELELQDARAARSRSSEASNSGAGAFGVNSLADDSDARRSSGSAPVSDTFDVGGSSGGGASDWSSPSPSPSPDVGGSGGGDW